MLRRAKNSSRRKSGQAIVFLIMVVFIGALVVLWNFDLHNIVSTKIRVDNAGDAAALSAARWQAVTLNMIGELNLVQAAYICDELASMDPSNPVQFYADMEGLADDIEWSIAPLRRRLSLVGPLMGLVAAQSAALQNLTDKDYERIEESDSDFMAQRGEDFENSNGYYMDEVEEPYDGAWEEYGSILSAVANNDMIVESGNTEYFLFYPTSHWLFNVYFYNAVNGNRVCFFSRGSARELLDSYIDYTSWDSLPDMIERNTVNSEYFSTDVYEWSVEFSLADYYTENTNGWSGYANMLTNYAAELSDEVGSATDLAEDFVGYLEETSPTDDTDVSLMANYGIALDCFWHYYNPYSWMWKRYSDSQKYFPTSDSFQIHEGWKFKDEYNYGGANAAVDVSLSSDIYTPGMQIAIGDIYWQASAKPFGYLADPSGVLEAVPPMYFGIVLPAFRDVRLIHNGLSTRQSGVDSPGWDEHMYTHVQEYVVQGIAGIEGNDCDYCDALIKWDESDFREEAKEWLEENQELIDAGVVCTNFPSSSNMNRG